ncbi:MAG: hypothetical protein KGJ02_04765 [Verrucomicrobiota bacterium]|nr:hypothetical protein [Verrucomicrobiota bacterium]
MRWFFFLLFLRSLFPTEIAVTYQFSGGRLGDNLLSYLHAKWFSYKKNIPLIYKPFPYSNELMLDVYETFADVSRPVIRNFKAQGPLHSSRLPILYTCPYFPEDPWELTHHQWFSFPVDWKNPEFRALARQIIAPKKQLDLVTPPSHTLNIALHIRQGGGFDHSHVYLDMPLKLPPLSFYVEGLQKVIALFPNKPIYCYLFTDAQDPALLAEQIQNQLPRPILFDYRHTDNQHDKNVLEDFFSLFQFDVLIRPQSNFSLIPSLIHDYAVVYSPRDFSLYDNVITITETDFHIDYVLIQRLQ